MEISRLNPMIHQVNIPKVNDLHIGHAALFDHTARCAVFRVRQRNDLIQSEMLKTKPDGGAGCFGGVTLPPTRLIEQESDFRFIELGQELQTNPADDLFFAIGQDAPVAVPIFFPMCSLAFDESLDFFQWGGVGLGK